jgi:excisionase family DNA binding protein
MSTEALLTVAEVAARLRVHPETVRRWLAQGRLEGVRPGGTKIGWRIPESALERFLAESPRADGREERGEQ